MSTDPRRGNRHVASWTRENVAERIALWAEIHGKPPSAAQWNPARARTMSSAASEKARKWLDGITAFEEGDWPSQDTVERLFGSWNDGMVAAGFAPRPKGRTPRSFDEAQGRTYAAHVDAMQDLRQSFARVEHARSASALASSVREVAAVALAWLEHIERCSLERAS